MRLTRTFRVICVIALIAAALPALTLHAQAPLKVVASFSILADFVQNVGGDKIALTTLVPAGSDAHTYEPSPQDSAALADAALIFEVGLEFEGWLESLYVSAGATAMRVTVTDGIEPLEAGGHHEGEHEGEEHEEGDHEHGEFDPHVWHDVTLAIKMVENIRDALIKADAANSETYTANAAAYIKELEALDAYVKSETRQLPEARRKIFTTHDTLVYFGVRYGFEVDSALGVTTEASDPSASDIAALIEEIKAAGVPAIFVDTVSNPRLMEQIAREAGVALAPPLYTDALGEVGSEGDTYLKLVRYNVQTIVVALK
ncbi:MAG: metal ABC transporter substrate-binding protein [Anaerolineae bacterium]